jgi:Ser/Thr protein kinase RdoA (MazF antagonist)
VIGEIMGDQEQRLSGGNVADRVVRIGDTVRKPATAATSSVEAFLDHLRCAGFSGAPRSLGRDEQGRHVLEYIPGSTVDMPHRLSAKDLSRVGRMIRELHLAAKSFIPPASAQWNVVIKPDSESMICHNDLAPWNLVCGGDQWVFIDWDGSGPGSVLWDVSYAAQSFVPLIRGGEPLLDAARLRHFVDGYGLDRSEREDLPQRIMQRTQAMFHLLERSSRTGQQPWARLFAEGHAKHWEDAAVYVERHSKIWKDTLLADYDD